MATYSLVNITEGTVRGKELCAGSFSKKKYVAFQGIPYAQPPVGRLRFRDPQPPSPWQGVRDALQHSAWCPQKHVLLREATGEEDNCLTLNVYTPHLPTSGAPSLPVMVWIHGGGFTFGSGDTDLHDPDYWMERDVVIVTCNYRVGALGFLSLGTEDVPGNAGLKDQVMVLRWVRDNIAQFGGDPHNVCLFGESAGAASVHCHLLSPMSRGLFHRAILMSGSSLNSWAFSPDATARSFRLGEALGCATADPHELLACLQAVPAFDLVKLQNKVITAQDKRDIRVFPFTPSVEPPARDGGGERFLTEHPRTLLQRGAVAPVPLIMGANSKEGMLILNDVSHSDQYFKVLDADFPRVVPANLGLPLNSADKIRRFFFKDKPVGWDTVDEYLDYFGDLLFYIGIEETIRLHLACAVAPVYVYDMTFDGELGFLSFFIRMQYPQCTLKGVSHADDLGYMFKYNLPGPPQLVPDSPEAKMVARMTGLWRQFAATGNPNLAGGEVRWEPAGLDGASWRGYLELGERLVTKNSRLQQNRMEFWDTLIRPLQQKL